MNTLGNILLMMIIWNLSVLPIIVVIYYIYNNYKRGDR